jgi:hypothetical protein
MSDKLGWAIQQMLQKIKSEEGTRLSSFSKKDQKLIQYMERRGLVTTEPIRNDWIVR